MLEDEVPDRAGMLALEGWAESREMGC